MTVNGQLGLETGRAFVKRGIRNVLHCQSERMVFKLPVRAGEEWIKQFMTVQRLGGPSRTQTLVRLCLQL